MDATWFMVCRAYVHELKDMSQLTDIVTSRPDHCDGSFDAYCDSHRKYTNITDILRSFSADDLLSTMSTYWKVS